jgi:hypothetical protein
LKGECNGEERVEEWRGKCVASAWSRMGKVAAGSRDAGGMEARKKESLEVGGSTG